MSTTGRILLIEDDDRIRGQVAAAMTVAGFEVRAEATGGAGRTAVGVYRPDLVLLDLGLPDIDGLQLCGDLRTLAPTLVIVALTARHDELDVVSALEAGADDYLFKPFKTVELIARVRAHLRRSRPADPGDTGRVHRVGDLTIDDRRREAHVRATPVPLRNREFDLLRRFAQSPGEALRREELLADVWDTAWEGSQKTLDVHVLALRRKLDLAAEHEPGARIPTIHTLRGHGYRLDLDT